MLKAIYYFLFIFFLFVACKGNEPIVEPDIKIEIEPQQLSFSYNQTSDILIVTANKDWGVSSSENWCKISPSGGISGITKIEVSVEKNDTDSLRTSTLTFKSGSFKHDYIISQQYELKAVSFSDDVFKNYCLEHFDTDTDGIVSVKEVSEISNLNISGLGINSIVGIQSFSKLTSVDCSNNKLSELEINDLILLKALNCSNNQLIELDIQSNINIEELDCSKNPTLKNIFVWSNFIPSTAFKKPDGAVYVEPEFVTPVGYNLVWNDEFNDSIVFPDTDNWWYETGNSGWGNNEIQNYIEAYRGIDTCVIVRNGVMKITALKSGSEVLSARINSTKSWKYGYFEARLKLPTGKGTWPAFWMLPKNFKNWPDDGEIDIMEEVGYRPNWISCSIHCKAYNHAINTQKTSEKFISTAQNEFHVYAVEWTEDFIKGYIDGEAYYEFKNDNKGDKSTWPFNQAFYLKINLAWGGNWGGAQGVDETALPTSYEIDYVRVFQKQN